MDEKTVRDAVELTDEVIGMVAGGEYGDLLAPVGAIEYVVCTVCGKVFTGAIHRTKGKVYCSDCWAQQSSQGE